MWFENTGEADIRFVEHRIEIDDSSVEATGFNLDFVDLSGDDRLDIVLGTPRPRTFLVWLEQPPDADEVWRSHGIGTTAPDHVTGFALADINEDGNLDVVVGGYSRGPRDIDGDVTRYDPLGRLAWFEHPGDPSATWIRHDISRRKRGMFDKFLSRDMDGDGDIDFVGTRGNSVPHDGVF